jgi:biotin operon repressor
MSFLRYFSRLERLHGLIRRKATGSPRELAQKLELSERQVYECLSEMKEMGAPIAFCNLRKTYYYSQEVSLHFGFVATNLSPDDQLTIGGGAYLPSGAGQQTLFENVLKKYF